MRKLMLCVSLLLVSCATDTSWHGEDKRLHMKYGVVIGAGTTVALNMTNYNGNRPLTSSLLCSGVGLSKELYDEYDYGGFDYKDLTYTTAACWLSSYSTHYMLNYNVVPMEDGVKINYKKEF